MLFRGSAEVRWQFRSAFAQQAAGCNFQRLKTSKKRSFSTCFDHTRNGKFVVGFAAYHIPAWLLSNAFATSCAFTGLIIGGIPAILRSLKDGWQSEEKKSLLVNILVFLILLAVAMAMVFLNGDSESGIALTASAGMLVKIFFMGIIASATMVIPGVSGSLVLMILGYYFGVINSVKQFVEALRTLNLQGMLNQLFILIPFAIGCVLGIFFISKLISYLLKHFASATFSGIFALVASSPISIFYKVNQEYSMNGTSVVSIIVGVVLLVACVALTLFMEKLGAPESTVSES